jgi:hypothetical protein
MMKASVLTAVVAVTLLGASSAEAHFKLQQPADALLTDATGNPVDGSQKTNPCGTGTASGMVTKVAAGSTQHIKLTETIGHPGHYRVSIIKQLSPVSSDLPEPIPVLSNGGTNCESAPIQATPVAPVIADGLFVHATGTTGAVYEGDVNLPTETGTYTLQVLEFMSSHAPGCFYHHCAVLEVVAADAGIPDGGIVTGPDGGSSGSSGSTGGGTSGGTGVGTSGGSSGPNSVRPAPKEDDGGCAVGGSSMPSFLALGLAGLFTMSMLRRRKK